MLANLIAAWRRTRLPHCDLPGEDLLDEAKTLHESGYYTAAAMTARAGLDRALRRVAERDGRELQRAARGANIRVVALMLRNRDLLPVKAHHRVNKALVRLNSVTHGGDCDSDHSARLMVRAGAAMDALRDAGLLETGEAER